MMKSKKILMAVSLVLVVATGLYANPLKSLTDKNKNLVMEQIAAQVVEAMPDDIHMRLLAIGPVQGGDGSFADLLTRQLKDKTKYRLIERHDLDRLLSEQGIQLSPVANEVRAVEPGKIQGVEALIMGKFISSQFSLIHGSAEIFIKLDNVETGEIIFAEKFSANYMSQAGTICGTVILGLLVLFFVSSRVKKRKLANVQKFLEENDTLRVEVTNDLKRARDNLTRVHDSLVSQNLIDLSSSIMEASKELKYLITQIEQTPGLRPDCVTAKDQKRAAHVTKSMKGLAKNVFAESEKLYSVVDNQQFSKADGLVKKLKEEIKNSINRFQDLASGSVS